MADPSRVSSSRISASGTSSASGESYSSITPHFVTEQNRMRLSPEEYSKKQKLRKDVRNHGKKFKGKRSFVKNISSGFEIKVTQNSIREATSGPRQLEELEAIRHLRGMLRRAKYIGPEPEAKGKQGVLQFHVFTAQRKIFGKKYDFIIKVKEMKDGKYFYDSYTKK